MLSSRNVGSFKSYAGVAQLVEHQLPKLRVAGSSPVSRSKNHYKIKYLPPVF